MRNFVNVGHGVKRARFSSHRTLRSLLISLLRLVRFAKIYKKISVVIGTLLIYLLISFGVNGVTWSSAWFSSASQVQVPLEFH